jgi:hypothetical protein
MAKSSCFSRAIVGPESMNRNMGILLFILSRKKRLEKVGTVEANRNCCYGDLFLGYINKSAWNFWQWRVKLSLNLLLAFYQK